jgi:hypothetical protein
MAISFTATDLSELSRLMRLMVDAGEPSITVLSCTQATGVLSSAYFSDAQLAELQRRATLIRAMVDAADKLLLAYMLPALVQFTDLTGVVTPEGTVDGNGIEYLNLVGFVDSQPAYVVATLPHSISGFVTAAP